MLNNAGTNCVETKSDSNEDPAQKPPHYIYVYVDTFLSHVLMMYTHTHTIKNTP